MNKESLADIEKVAKKAAACFKKTDGDMFKACIAGVWYSGSPLCRRGPTDIGRRFVQECLLLIAEFTVGVNDLDKDTSAFLDKVGLAGGSYCTPPFSKVYFSEVRALFKDHINYCHNGYCDEVGGGIYCRVQRIFDEFSTISDKEWDEAIDWLYKETKQSNTPIYSRK